MRDRLISEAHDRRGVRVAFLDGTALLLSDALGRLFPGAYPALEPHAGDVAVPSLDGLLGKAGWTLGHLFRLGRGAA